MTDKNRRRVRIIDQYQFRFIMWLLLVIIMVSALLGLATFILIRQEISKLPQPLPPGTDLFQLLLYKPFLTVVIIALFLYIITFWLLIVLTHKVYGPMYRLGMFIKSLSKGEKTGELQFRKGDVVDHLSDLYNELYASIQKVLNYDYQSLMRVFSELEDVLDQVYNRKVEHTELFNSLQNICNRIARALDITMTRIRR